MYYNSDILKMEKNYPKVSIITPSFNQGKYLEDTILSVVTQSYPNLEYIIVDGGSKDNSLEIIKKYTEKYKFIKWVSESDAGQSNAINKGFKLSTGDIVAWLNSDDTYCSDSIANAVDFFYSNSDLDLMYGNANIIDEKGIFKEKFSLVENYNLERLKNINIFIMQPTTFWKREVFDKVGFLDESLYYTMDWDFWIRIGNCCKVGYNNKVIANTREYLSTKTFDGGFRRFKEIKMILRRYGNKRYPPLYWTMLFDIIYKKLYKISPEGANTIKNSLTSFKKILYK